MSGDVSDSGPAWQYPDGHHAGGRREANNSHRRPGGQCARGTTRIPRRSRERYQLSLCSRLYRGAGGPGESRMLTRPVPGIMVILPV
jgi:hypothetical protein